MNISLFTQIGLLIAAVVIGVIFIRPQFAEIGSTQDNISEIRELIADTKELNRVLLEKANAVQSISGQNQQRLVTYLPQEVDELGVMADVSAMASVAGVAIDEFAKIDRPEVSNQQDVFSANNAAQAESESGEPLTGADFSLTVSGSYESLQNFLGLIAVNNYPIAISQLEIAPNESSRDEVGAGALTGKVTFTVPTFTTVTARPADSSANGSSL